MKQESSTVVIAVRLRSCKIFLHAEYGTESRPYPTLAKLWQPVFAIRVNQSDTPGDKGYS